jgi:hypothetical protein
LYLKKVQGDETKYDFSFDNILGPETSQPEVFQIVAKPVIESKINFPNEKNNTLL